MWNLPKGEAKSWLELSGEGEGARISMRPAGAAGWRGAVPLYRPQVPEATHSPSSERRMSGLRAQPGGPRLQPYPTRTRRASSGLSSASLFLPGPHKFSR